MTQAVTQRSGRQTTGLESHYRKTAKQVVNATGHRAGRQPRVTFPATRGLLVIILSQRYVQVPERKDHILQPTVGNHVRVETVRTVLPSHSKDHPNPPHQGQRSRCEYFQAERAAIVQTTVKY